MLLLLCKVLCTPGMVRTVRDGERLCTLEETTICLGDVLNGMHEDEWMNSYNVPTCNFDRPKNYFTPRLDKFYRIPSLFQRYSFIKVLGSKNLTWTSLRKRCSGTDYPKHFCTTSPHQMYWCLRDLQILLLFRPTIVLMLVAI